MMLGLEVVRNCIRDNAADVHIDECNNRIQTKSIFLINKKECCLCKVVVLIFNLIRSVF